MCYVVYMKLRKNKLTKVAKLMKAKGKKNILLTLSKIIEKKSKIFLDKTPFLCYIVYIR